MRIQIYISVIVSILIQKTASKAASLPSPANVSIQCDSYGAEVRWEYPDLRQNVYFEVKVIDDRKGSIPRKSSTQNLHLNISSMLYNSAYNRYYVNVMALRGEEKSNSTESDAFSYNYHASANIKCYLDFPEVKLSPKDGKLHVQFTNPLQLYSNTPALRNVTDNLQYCIETEENNQCETCKLVHSTCETSVEFSEHKGEYCMSLTGEIGQRFFNLRSSCFTGDVRIYTPVTVYVFPVLGVLSTLLLITFVIILLAKKCNSEMKKKVPSMFQSFFDFGETESRQTRTLHVVPENVEQYLQIEPAEDPKEQTTLILSDEPEDLGSYDSKHNLSYGPNDLVDNEQSSSSDFYDCPHAPGQRQEMSPGDTVDGYGPKLL